MNALAANATDLASDDPPVRRAGIARPALYFSMAVIAVVGALLGFASGVVVNFALGIWELC